MEGNSYDLNNSYVYFCRKTRTKRLEGISANPERVNAKYILLEKLPTPNDNE